jgi:hypothetical protein
VVAWFEMHKERIAKTLCENRDKPQLKCNGKCYLRKQLNKVPGNEQLPGKPQSQKSVDWLVFLAADKVTFTIAPKPLVKPVDTIYQRHYHFLHCADVFHPPPYSC